MFKCISAMCQHTETLFCKINKFNFEKEIYVHDIKSIDFINLLN